MFFVNFHEVKLHRPRRVNLAENGEDYKWRKTLTTDD